MPTTKWTVTLPDGAHQVELDHKLVSGQKTLRVDGREIDLGKESAFAGGSDHAFELGGRPAFVRLEPVGVHYRYDLVVDGRSVGTGEAADMRVPAPAWSWAFVVGCGAIPVALGIGPIPAAIGFGAGGLCFQLARVGRRTVRERAVLCALILAAAWALALVLYATIAPRLGTLWVQSRDR